MIVEVESLGFDHRDFFQLRDELIAKDAQFDAISLRYIPYEQLVWCCTGEAKSAVCLPQLIIEEKQNRRERFLAMEPEELAECLHFLQMEQMYEDVRFAIAYRSAPRWEELTAAAQAWAKLNCVFNHVDFPIPRLSEAVSLLSKVINEDQSMPPEAADNYRQKIKNLMSLLPNRISDGQLREKVGEFAENLLDFLNEKERSVCEREELQDYSCTSDCYRVII